jgi:hypothetical protein
MPKGNMKKIDEMYTFVCACVRKLDRACQNTPRTNICEDEGAFMNMQ